MEPILNIHQFIEEADDDTLTDVFFADEDELSDEYWQAIHDEMVRRDLVTDDPASEPVS